MKHWKFWRKVFIKDENECWEWQGHIDHGYGRSHLDGIKDYAHRVAYRLTYGNIPTGLIVAHKCDNKICVNPNHLEAVSFSKNNSDAFTRGLKFNTKRKQHGL